MRMLLLRSNWSNFQVFVRNGLRLTQIVFLTNFLVQIRDQHSKIDPCGKFQSNWTKNRARISTSVDTENCLMTSH